MKKLILLAVLVSLALTPAWARRRDREEVEEEEVEEEVVEQEETTAAERWTPLARIRLGNLPVKVGAREDYKIPRQVPSDAREVLVYAYIRTGVSDGNGDLEVRIFTREDKTEYAFYLFSHVYPQTAYSYNSDTFWLPMPSDRRIFAQAEGEAGGGKRIGNLFLLGYR